MIIPDGIEPLILARSWIFDGTHLRSPQQAHHVWKPGEPFEATCTQTRAGWWVERGRGYTLERCAELHEQGGPVPTVALPPGFGYVWDTRPAHDGCPHETCSCGVYGTTAEDAIIGTFGQVTYYDPNPPSSYNAFRMGLGSGSQGTIVGALVSLWGKVIEGEKGARAQFAYPAELVVPARLGDSEALKAYGVPISVVAEPSEPSEPSRIAQPFWTPRKVLTFAIGANVGACAVNVSHIAGLW